jgi:hypothetical protein
MRSIAALAALTVTMGLLSVDASAVDCPCNNMPSASSVSDEGTCRLRETNAPSCTIRWFHDSVGGDSSTAEVDRGYVDALESGAFGDMGQFTSQGEWIEDVLRAAASNHVEITGEESPAFHAGVYLGRTPPQEYEHDALIASLTVLLGAGLRPQSWSNLGLVAMVQRLSEASQDVFGRVRGDEDSPEVDGEGIDDLSSFGCFEFVFPDAPEGSLSAVMIKTQFAPQQGRCRQ